MTYYTALMIKLKQTIASMPHMEGVNRHDEVVASTPPTRSISFILVNAGIKTSLILRIVEQIQQQYQCRFILHTFEC
jgi:hypothetical protein